jgi:uncharacterized membrane protein YeaQ/YmgE (transglycosylase-associated protein family)
MQEGHATCLLFSGLFHLHARFVIHSGERRKQQQPKGGAMGVLAWIIFGLIAGIVAKLIMPGKDPGGFFVTILIGIAGAVIGGFIGSLLGFGGVEGFDFRSFLIAIVGALILLFIYRKAKST